jgi:hypothetical protein
MVGPDGAVLAKGQNRVTRDLDPVGTADASAPFDAWLAQESRADY